MATVYAQGDIEATFREELSKITIRSSVPVQLADSKMYRGVALAPPVSAWSLVETDDRFIDRPYGSSSLASQFNYAIEVRGGVAYLQRTQPLERLWKRVLVCSLPEEPFSESRVLSDSALFQPIDRIDEARGISARVRSNEYLRYLEYRSAWRILASATDDDGNWRLHPRFSGFASLKEAKEEFGAEWKLLGHKRLIEEALDEIASIGMDDLTMARLWAKTAFDDATLEIIDGVPVGRTFFFPNAVSWGDMRAWSKTVFTSDVEESIKCEIAVVEIRRPWLYLSLLNHPQFKITRDTGLGVISDGATPTPTDFAKGKMASIPESIILARRIEVGSSNSAHPLARFVSRESINLVGFVVVSLPEMSGKVEE